MFPSLKKIFVVILIFLLNLLLYYQYRSITYYKTHSCILTKEEQYIEETKLKESQFIKNMRLIQNQRIKKGFNSKYTVSKMNFSDPEPHPIIYLTPFIFYYNSEFFTFVENGEIFPPDSCNSGKLYEPNGIITWRFVIDWSKNARTFFKKSHDELMCRNMGKYSMSCPETYIITHTINELDIFLSKYENNNDISWIVKKDASAIGMGMTLLSNPLEIKEKVEELLYHTTTKDGAVIQRILVNPYLYNNRRFSFRIWTSITSVKPFKLYYSKMFFLFLAGTYTDNNADKDQVLSNFGFHNDWNNKVDSYVFLQHLRENNLITKWLEYTLPLIKNGFYEFLSQKTIVEPKVKTYELFGCDVILDNNLTPYLLECNPCAGRVDGIPEYTVLEELLYIALYEELNNNETPNNLQMWEELHPQ